MTRHWTPEFTHEGLEIISKQRVYDGYCPIDEYRFRFRSFRGGFSNIVKRELILRPKVAAVLLYDPKKDKVVMIEQIRVGAFQYKDSPWILEIVAGIVDPGETMIEAAHREANEEAGLKINKLIHVCDYLVSPGISDEETHIFCGFVDAVEGLSFHGLIDDGEDIKVHVLTSKEVFLLLKQGNITSASAVIAVQWLELNHSTLRNSY